VKLLHQAVQVVLRHHLLRQQHLEQPFPLNN
jgi:hypothetical protein